MSKICVDPDPVTGDQPPAYCNKNEYTQTAEYQSMCQTHKNALGMLWNDTDPSTNTTSTAETYYMPLAACHPVSSSMIAEASNNGLDIRSLQSNWAAQSSGVPSESQCNHSGYGIFDPVTGEKVMMPNAAGASVPMTVQGLYESKFADCDSNTAVAPYFLANATGTCPTAEFVSQCQDPKDTYYAPCKLPGWDYLDTDKSTWSYDMNSCTNASFSGADYATKSNNAAGVDCTKQCCVYASLRSTDVGSINCESCTQASDSSSPYYVDWGNGPQLTLTNATGGSMSVPYCNQYNGASMNNSQGFAISLADAETNPDVAYFGDPAACRSGGKFEGSCNGITGCDGAANAPSAGYAMRTQPCRMGFSTGPPFNAANNCPNIYTLTNSAENCIFSTTESNGVQHVCEPAIPLTTTDGTCNRDFTDSQWNQRPVTTNDGVPRVKQMTLPEGAWVTVYDTANDPGNTMSPYRVNNNLCEPATFPENGGSAWTFACGRDSVGNLKGKSQAITVKQSGVWEPGTKNTENAGECSSDISGCNVTSTEFDASRQTGDVTVNTDAHTCTFTVNDQTPLYGWSLGFMPGYYNSSCTTSGKGNQCGTI